MIKKQIVDSAFVAEQIAGSCRIEGLQVSQERLLLMQKILQGTADAKQLRKEAIEKHRQSGL